MQELLSPKLDERAKEVASFIAARAPSRYYDFSEEKPPTNDPAVVANYYAIVVSLDYGFWRFLNGQFKADFYNIDGKPIKGATFLWIKSKAQFASNPSFFNLTELRHIKWDQFQAWLKDDSGTVPFKDPTTRFFLVRNFAEKMWNHPVHKTFMEGQQSIAALSQILESCSAYADAPFCKKAHLLAKIMERQGYWKVSDPENKLPPIDYHLINMATKLDLVTISPNMASKLAGYQPLNSTEELQLRSTCADAYRAITRHSGIDPYKLDDIIWSESRRNCQLPPYRCEQCLFNPICHKNITGFPVVETYRY